MSSSNIQSTINFTSTPTESPPPLPSVFELLAQERLTDLIRPCLRQILKYLHEIRPLNKSFRILYRYKDEFILLFETFVQWFYLHSHTALIGERFYGLKRTADHRLRSLIFSVFLPYVKLKLDSLYENMRMNDTNRHQTFYITLKILPKVKMFIEGVEWLYRLGYAFGRTEYYSPALQLAGVKLTYLKDPSPATPPATFFGRIFSLLSQIMSSGLFVIQFVDWWNSTNGSKQNPLNSNNIPPLPKTIQPRTNIGKRQCPLCRQICNVPTAVLGSGFVYCHQCITDYVKRYHRCPTTNQPVTMEQLIKIY